MVMNVETGEMVELSEELSAKIEEAGPEEMFDVFPRSGVTAKKDIKTIFVGEIVEVKGIPCKIVFINAKKNKFSLQAIGTLKVSP
jgi:hypothetical protein